MSSEKDQPEDGFAKDQPRDGDTILHCGHVDRGPVTKRPWHWFKYEAVVCFKRPDGTAGEAEWLVICETCFGKHGSSTPARGDCQWIGDDPAIMKTEN